MPRTAQRVKGGKQIVPFNVDGFVGCRDQRSAKYAPGEMDAIFNMMPETRSRPSKLVLRPGFKRYCAEGVGTAVNVTASYTAIQAVDGFIGGVHFALVITNAGVWRINHATQTLSLVLTAANITGAGATISSFTKALFYNGKLVVACSVGKPWTWNGTSGAGITLLANAPTGITSSTVYSGKLFLLSAGILYWSEEGDETIGYNTAPYSNWWLLQQTGQNPLADLCGTNDGLFYLRLNAGVGLIRGPADSNFKTTGTHDEVSTAIGSSGLGGASADPTAAPNGVVMFFDHIGRPSLYRPGSGVVRLWEQMPRVFGEGTGGLWDQFPWSFSFAPGEVEQVLTGSTVSCYHDSRWNCHAYAINANATVYTFLFDDQTDRLVAMWTTFISGGIVTLIQLDSGGNVTVPVHFKIDELGFLYWQDYRGLVNTGRTWSEETSAAAGQPIKGTVLGPPHGWNTSLDYWWERFDVVVEARAQHTVKFSYVSSAQHKGVLSNLFQTFTESGLANTPNERHVEFGIDVPPARWLRPQIQVVPVAGVDQQLGIYGYRLEARPEAQSLGTL